MTRFTHGRQGGQTEQKEKIKNNCQKLNPDETKAVCNPNKP